MERADQTQNRQTSGRVQALPLARVTIADAFWGPRLEQLRTVTLADVFTKFERDGAFANFDLVAGGRGGAHRGEPWFDGLIFETIRAAADFLAKFPDAGLDARLDGYIARIAAAQAADPDGYLNSYVTLTFPERRWGANGGNQLYSHEEYNAGCLFEAAVHHYRATGKTSLLVLAVRFANYLCELIGPPPRRNIVPSHSLPEESLLKLYQLLRAEPAIAGQVAAVAPERYLELVRFWVEHRGNYQGRVGFTEYAQDHQPVLAQTSAVGHAVRATLLYTGVAALAAEIGADELDQLSERLWRDVTERKLYLTGGVGSINQYEGFSFGYYLPSNGYNETCAAVGLAFWAHRLHALTADARYAEVIERVIYNGALAGIALNGTTYSYQNPLANRGEIHRWDWHSCPCCPPMLLKLYAGLAEHIYAYDGQTVYVNQYIGSRASIPLAAGPIELVLHSELPWHGRVSATLHLAAGQRFGLHVRVPDWCAALQVRINGQPQPVPAPVAGYARFEREWHAGDSVELELALPVQRLIAHPFVSQLGEQVAIRRGPLIYCVEGVDNQDVFDIIMDAEPRFVASYEPDLLGGVVAIAAQTSAGGLLRAVPYYAWDNRAADAAQDWMAVWIKQANSYALRQRLAGDDLASWARHLYRPLLEARSDP